MTLNINADNGIRLTKNTGSIYQQLWWPSIWTWRYFYGMNISEKKSFGYMNKDIKLQCLCLEFLNAFKNYDQTCSYGWIKWWSMIHNMSSWLLSGGIEKIYTYIGLKINTFKYYSNFDIKQFHSTKSISFHLNCSSLPVDFFSSWRKHCWSFR